MTKLSGSYTGAGQNVGLIEFDAFKQADIDAWTKNFGQPSVTPKVVPVNGGVSQPGSDQLEVTLDVEAVAATAPGAAQTVYEAPNSDAAWVDEMAKIASDNSITILSGSWLNGEKCESSPIKASHDSYTQMAAQGITMLSASGDWGATGCGYQGDNSTVQADFPASDPLFTGVGGTQLRTSDSAGTYQAESCWNQGGSGNTRSGGGYSQIYAKPSWQPGSSQFRSVPDVALDADYGACRAVGVHERRLAGRRRHQPLVPAVGRVRRHGQPEGQGPGQEHGRRDEPGDLRGRGLGAVRVDLPRRHQRRQRHLQRGHRLRPVHRLGFAAGRQPGRPADQRHRARPGERLLRGRVTGVGERGPGPAGHDVRHHERHEGECPGHRAVGGRAAHAA